LRLCAEISGGQEISGWVEGLRYFKEQQIARGNLLLQDTIVKEGFPNKDVHNFKLKMKK